MTLKPLIFAALAFGALATGQAQAQDSDKTSPVRCTLTASSNFVLIGQSYSYTVRVSFTEFMQPPPSFRPFTVVFFGSKNGVNDIGPNGEIYLENIRGNFDNVLGGY